MDTNTVGKAIQRRMSTPCLRGWKENSGIFAYFILMLDVQRSIVSVLQKDMFNAQ